MAGCAGLARCDFFVEPDGRSSSTRSTRRPGFTETSVYAKLWEAAGLSYPTSATASSALAVERHERRGRTSSRPRSASYLTILKLAVLETEPVLPTSR